MAVLVAMVRQGTIRKLICHLVTLKQERFYCAPGAEVEANRVAAQQPKAQAGGVAVQTILVKQAQVELAETVAHPITLP